MPPVNRDDEPIDIVARPVNPDGTIGQPETGTSSGSESTDVTIHVSRGDYGDGAPREEVRYWRFESRGDDGCGCGGCGCLTAIVLLMLMFLLKTCGL